MCERLHFEGGWNFTPIVRGTGNAGRIARLPLNLRLLDLMDRKAVFEAVKDYDVLVNCARGSETEMVQGLQNLIDAAKVSRPKKLIHLSSAAIYGSDPAADAATEAGVPNPGRNEYGIAKLKQDEAVLRLHQAGVPCYILVPGNITGPYSGFSRGIMERLLAGPMPVVDGGRYASNMIHVDNLVEAILAAVRADSGAGERYFVNEVRPVSWREAFDAFADRAGVKCEYVEVSREAVLPYVHPPVASTGLAKHAKVMLSADFRRAMSALPVLDAVNKTARSLFDMLPDTRQQAIKERVQWPIRVPRDSSGPQLNDRYVTVQARRQYHSPVKLQQKLGWQPPLTFEQGMDTIFEWLRFVGAAPARMASRSTGFAESQTTAL
jgi:nucleoside-diphosphate-sugar epimerase